MSQKIRREQILEILQKRRFVTVRYLVETLDYSSATINRDLNAMEVLHLVKRSYGGVELAQKHDLPPLAERQFYMKKEKRRLAQAAAKLIENGDTVFLGGGTTVQYIGQFLSEKKDLRIITNNMHLASALGEFDFDIICHGGSISERPYVLDGDITIENAMRLEADKLFFSVDRVSLDGHVPGGFLLRVMMNNSRESYFMTDKTKISDRIGVRLCDFSELTGVISDIQFPKETLERYPNVRFITAKDGGE